MEGNLNPRYSIITPTILRDSLLRCCESINIQSFTGWEHLVIVDTDITNDVLARIAHPQRRIYRCERPHRNWGHSCRHRAWGLATGDYIYCLDDDNFFASPHSLDQMNKVTAEWAIFPITRHDGFENDPATGYFFNDPPGMKRTDTGSIVVRRSLGPWPDITHYATDGLFVESLMKKGIPYQAFPNDPPIAVMSSTSISVSDSQSGNRVSIFTPCHDITYLRDAYESIKDQDFYEWVIVYNNGGVPIDFHDPRVHSHTLYKSPEKVGPLKAYACDHCSGDILLELDCDDLLMPTTIAEVQSTFADPEVGFAYSNNIHVTADLNKFPRYDESFGWKYREAEFRGHQLDEFVSFPPSPEMVSRVWFGPDHLRAFRRSVYKRIGGYDQSLRVLDDSDLCCRMYLATKMVHIDKPLYVYRVHGQNSWLRYNEEIQKGVYGVYDKYIEALVRRWAEMNSLPVIEVKSRDELWKHPDSSVGVFKATDTFAMFADPLGTMRDVYRALVPGGWLLCQVPSTDGRGAWQDPRHVSRWNQNSFLYYSNRQWAQWINTPVRFQCTRLYTTPMNDHQVCWTVAHLISLKDGYRPCGQIDI